MIYTSILLSDGTRLPKFMTFDGKNYYINTTNSTDIGKYYVNLTGSVSGSTLNAT